MKSKINRFSPQKTKPDATKAATGFKYLSLPPTALSCLQF
jgi:hypothetical protein